MTTPTTANLTPSDPRPCAGRHRGQADACTGPDSCGLPMSTHRGDAEAHTAGIAWGLGHSLAINGSTMSATLDVARAEDYNAAHVEVGWNAGVAERQAERDEKAAARKAKRALQPLRRVIELAAQASEAVANDDPATARALAGDMLKRAVEAMNVLGRFPVVVVAAGSPPEGSRMVGFRVPISVSVWGRTETEAAENAQRVVDLLEEVPYAFGLVVPRHVLYGKRRVVRMPDAIRKLARLERILKDGDKFGARRKTMKRLRAMLEAF